MIKKTDYYNYFKVIITFLVVIGHAARMFSGHGALNVEKNIVINVINNLIYGFHMPAFMLLSGCIYYYSICDLRKYRDNHAFVLKKIKRLIIPYLVFGFLYVGPVLVIWNFTKYNYFEWIVKGLLLLLESRHLWFLAYLFLYFLITQFLVRKMCDKEKIYLIILCIIMSFLNIIYIYQI